MKAIEDTDLAGVCGGNFMRNFFFGQRLREAFSGNPEAPQPNQPNQQTNGGSVAPTAPHIPNTTEQR